MQRGLDDELLADPDAGGRHAADLGYVADAAADVARLPQQVGQRTTTAVVQGIFLVIVLDAFFAVFFTEIGWL
jgi:hypothetical protein